MDAKIEGKFQEAIDNRDDIRARNKKRNEVDECRSSAGLCYPCEHDVPLLLDALDEAFEIIGRYRERR